MGSKLTYTVKGPIASFRSADKAPIESLKLHFLPQQEGSGDPSPTNIRPITGWTGCNGRRSGKNLLPNNIVSGTEHSQGLIFVQNADGSIRITGKGNNTVTKLAVIKNFTNGSFPLKAGTYRPHIWSTDTIKSQIYISIMYNDGDNSMYCNANGTSYSYTISEDVYVNQIRIGLQPSENVEFDLTIYPSLEKGSTPTSWEPCQSEHIPLSWSSHGVEYGGYIDPVRGKIVAEYKAHIYDGGEELNEYSRTFTGGIRIANNTLDDCTGVGAYTKCDKAVLESTTPSDISRLGVRIGGGAYKTYFYVPDSMFDGGATVDKFKAWLTENNMTIVAKLTAPIEYDIDPITLQTFLDYNNFWSDTNDDTEVEYAFADRLSERKLIMNTPHISSASGSVSSFNTDMKAPLEELKVHFAPVQEGTGDPSPTNVRPITGWTGANISTVDAYEFYQGGLADVTGAETSNNVRIRTDYIPYVGSQSLVLNGVFDADDRCRSLYWYDSNKEFIRIGGTNHDFPYNYGAVNDPNNAYFRVVVQKSDNTKTISPNGKCLVLPKETYPIKFPATKNLYDATTYPLRSSHWINGKTGATSGNDLYACTLAYVPCREFAGKTVTMNTHLASTATNPGIAFYDSSKTYISGIINNGTSGTSLTFAVPSDAYYMRFTVNAGTTNIQIELGSTVTPYEPYGTVYGGYIDLIRGKIVAEYGRHIFDGTETNMAMNFRVSNAVYTIIGESTCAYGNNGMIYSNLLTTSLNHGQNKCYQMPSDPGYLLDFGRTTICDLALEEFDELTNAQQIQLLRTYLADLYANGTPLEVVFKLIAPIEYDITPELLKSLKGQNNIFADTNGNVDVKYWTH